MVPWPSRPHLGAEVGAAHLGAVGTTMPWMQSQRHSVWPTWTAQRARTSTLQALRAQHAQGIQAAPLPLRQQTRHQNRQKGDLEHPMALPNGSACWTARHGPCPPPQTGSQRNMLPSTRIRGDNTCSRTNSNREHMLFDSNSFRKHLLAGSRLKRYLAGPPPRNSQNLSHRRPEARSPGSICVHRNPRRQLVTWPCVGRFCGWGFDGPTWGSPPSIVS